jgi:antitoxin VapB
MNALHRTRTFKSGNSVAVRLPKDLSFSAGVEVALERRGEEVVIRRVVDTAAEKAAIAALVARLREIGPVGEIEQRDPDIFPERPGLY